MMVLAIVGCILLVIVLALLIVSIFILFSRIRVDLSAKDKRIEVRIGIGPIRIKVWPFPFKSRPKSNDAPQVSTQEEQVHASKFSFDKIDWRDALDLALDMLGEIKDRIYLEIIFVDILIGTADAAKTALLLGYSAAATGMILPFLEQNFNIQDCHIRVDGDFDTNSTHGEVNVVFATQPIRMLAVLWHNRKPLWKMYRQITKKEEANTYERSSN